MHAGSKRAALRACLVAIVTALLCLGVYSLVAAFAHSQAWLLVTDIVCILVMAAVVVWTLKALLRLGHDEARNNPPPW